MNDDTIIAVSTSFGYGGIGIVRLSGDRALPVAKKIFHPERNYSGEPRRMIFGKIYHPEREEYFEEAMLVYFPAPKSYTSEDVVEISCHGSPVILEEIVRLGIKAGARQARPGEFTQRAFLNGRMDMMQAEAVNDLIHASSLEQAELSYRQVSGSLSGEIKELRRRIIHILSQIEASLEFPEDKVTTSSKKIKKAILNTREKTGDLIKSYDIGKVLKSGIQVAIIGAPNVGKSTLFNSLLKEERAIVTPFPGTTRDYLSEPTLINGSRISLVDMAGVDTPRNPVEKEGIQKGKKIADESDGILLLLDGSRRETRHDLDLLKKYCRRRTIVVLNKMDLPRIINADRVRKAAAECPVREISALKKTCLDGLKKEMVDKFVPKHSENRELVFHLRQKILLEEISGCLDNAVNMLERRQSEEIAAEEIRGTLPLIQQMTGEIRSDEIINDIFSRFCIGK